ncbi:MAG: thiol:disulfide interchange protein DsbA/DsbL, partial [Paucibacter sp.]|nr:thiol:disulfide interchange protein DsbA/DsbL [Roseateles sp.]
MKRRDFSAQLGLGALAVGVAGLGASGQARAQGGFVEGQQYIRLGAPLPTPAGKIEVVEFFWYGCPHCFSFEPVIGSWAQHLAPDVSLRRVHVAFRENLKVHQRTFFALEALGRETELRPRIFNQIHREHDYLDSEESMTAFLAKQGLDPVKFKEAYNSFGVANKCTQADK